MTARTHVERHRQSRRHRTRRTGAARWMLPAVRNREAFNRHTGNGASTARTIARVEAVRAPASPRRATRPRRLTSHASKRQRTRTLAASDSSGRPRSKAPRWATRLVEHPDRRPAAPYHRVRSARSGRASNGRGGVPLSPEAAAVVAEAPPLLALLCPKWREDQRNYPFVGNESRRSEGLHLHSMWHLCFTGVRHSQGVPSGPSG